MTTTKRRMRPAIILFLGTLAIGTTGQQCSISFLPPPVTPVATVDVELINNTPDPVDPGLFVNGEGFLIDPPLAPGDSLVLVVDCFEGTLLQTDATLLSAAGAIPSVNVPFAEEGFEFLCGDVVSFFFVEDATGFFTQLAVNDFLVVQ